MKELIVSVHGEDKSIAVSARERYMPALKEIVNDSPKMNLLAETSKTHFIAYYSAIMEQADLDDIKAKMEAVGG